MRATPISRARRPLHRMHRFRFSTLQPNGTRTKWFRGHAQTQRAPRSTFLNVLYKCVWRASSDEKSADRLVRREGRPATRAILGPRRSGRSCIGHSQTYGYGLARGDARLADGARRLPATVLRSPTHTTSHDVGADFCCSSAHCGSPAGSSPAGPPSKYDTVFVL